MRRYLPALLLVAAVAPFAITGCDLLKKKEVDAGDDAAAVVAAVADAGVAPVDTTTPPTAATPITPTPTGTLRPAVKTDAAAPAADAGVKTDGGAAPSPTPTLTIPNLFDGGGFKFDAGGFKPPWQK